ncbi:hypothetical protein CSUNSWCD_1648 [Campylobacter showae CSUNSWCD]|uniref:Uncharacterized protein n=1 Tax=Campylobacter showae CSUNSWCD TaxID=1244083 RepID=M5IKM4_9BACT|nr:hypothetical protein CSUNSWCD_1648 [Campylobacter showae CSUNSWCD]
MSQIWVLSSNLTLKRTRLNLEFKFNCDSLFKLDNFIKARVKPKSLSSKFILQAN